MNLNGVHFDEGPVTEDPKLGTTEGWVYVNLTADTNPMHYPSRHLPGRRTDTVRRPSLRGSQRRPTRRPRRNRPDPVRDRPNAPARPDRTRLQGHTQSQPRLLDNHPRQIRPSRGSLRAANLRPPLPHRRTRRQRHDATPYRRALVTQSQRRRDDVEPCRSATRTKDVELCGSRPSRLNTLSRAGPPKRAAGEPESVGV